MNGLGRGLDESVQAEPKDPRVDGLYKIPLNAASLSSPTRHSPLPCRRRPQYLFFFHLLVVFFSSTMSTECILNSFFTGASLSYASMHPFTPAGVRQRRGSVAHASCYPVLIRWLETTSEQVLSQYPIFWDSVQNFDQTGTVYRKLLQYEKQALDYVYAIGQNLSTVQYLKYPHEFNPRLKDLPHGELPLWQRLRLAALRYLYSISRGSNTTEDHTFLVQVCRSVLK